MRQFKVSHPGEIIARDLADMGISGRRFALNIDVTPATAGNSNCCCIRLYCVYRVLMIYAN